MTTEAARAENSFATFASDGYGGDVLARTARERTGVAVTPVSWRGPGDELPLEEWVRQGQQLGRVSRSAGWWIGDWLRYGNAKFGERYVVAAKVTGYDVQTLMNMVYVTSAIDVSRRRENLSWSHHAEVAALSPEDQERWLGHAEAERLSVRDLRLELRNERRAARAAEDERDGDAQLGAGSNGSDFSGQLDVRDLSCPHCGESLAQLLKSAQG